MYKCPILKRGDLRDALVDYALYRTEKGDIEAMSLREAARDLGVSSGAVYRHFKDRDDLLMDVVQRGFDMMSETFFAMRPEGAVATSLKVALERKFRISRYYIQFAHDKPRLFNLMFGRVGQMCRERFMSDPENMKYTSFDVVSEGIADFYRLGAISRKPDIQDVRFIWSASHGAAHLAQYGARMDADSLTMVADDTVMKALRVLGLEVTEEMLAGLDL